MKTIGALCLFGIFALSLLSAPAESQSGTITASLIRLVDEHGAVRTYIQPGHITVYGPGGKQAGADRADMATSIQGGALVTVRSGNKRIKMSCGWRPELQDAVPRYRDQISCSFDVPIEGTSEEQRVNRMLLDLSGDAPILQFFDADGATTFQVP